MEHPNVTLVRNGLAAFERSDLESIRAVFAPNAVWQAAGRNWAVGTYQGADSILAFLGTLRMYAQGTYRLEVRDILANDTRAVVLNHATAHRDDGRTMDVDAVMILDFADSVVSRVQTWPADMYAEDEYYGSEPPGPVL